MQLKQPKEMYLQNNMSCSIKMHFNLKFELQHILRIVNNNIEI